MAPVILIKTKSSEEVDRAEKAPGLETAAVVKPIAETTQSLNICWKGKQKMVAFLNLPLQKPGIEPLNTSRLLILFQYYVQTRAMNASMMYIKCEQIWTKLISHCHI